MRNLMFLLVLTFASACAVGEPIPNQNVADGGVSADASVDAN